MGPTTMSGGDDVRRKKFCIAYEKILCVWYSEAIKKELKENNKKTKSVLWTERRLWLFSTPLSFISSPYIRKKMAADDEAERRFCIYEYVKATLLRRVHLRHQNWSGPSDYVPTALPKRPPFHRFLEQRLTWAASSVMLLRFTLKAEGEGCHVDGMNGSSV